MVFSLVSWGIRTSFRIGLFFLWRIPIKFVLSFFSPKLLRWLHLTPKKSGRRKSLPAPSKVKRSKSAVAGKKSSSSVYNESKPFYKTTAKSKPSSLKDINRSAYEKYRQQADLAELLSLPSWLSPFPSLSLLTSENGYFYAKDLGLEDAILVGATTEHQTSPFTGTLKVLSAVVAFFSLTIFITTLGGTKLFYFYMLTAPLLMTYLIHRGRRMALMLFTLVFLDKNGREVSISFRESRDTVLNFIMHLTKMSAVLHGRRTQHQTQTQSVPHFVSDDDTTDFDFFGREFRPRA